MEENRKVNTTRMSAEEKAQRKARMAEAVRYLQQIIVEMHRVWRPIITKMEIGAELMELMYCGWRYRGLETPIAEIIRDIICYKDFIQSYDTKNNPYKPENEEEEREVPEYEIGADKMSDIEKHVRDFIYTASFDPDINRDKVKVYNWIKKVVEAAGVEGILRRLQADPQNKQLLDELAKARKQENLLIAKQILRYNVTPIEWCANQVTWVAEKPEFVKFKYDHPDERICKADEVTEFFRRLLPLMDCMEQAIQELEEEIETEREKSRERQQS